MKTEKKFAIRTSGFILYFMISMIFLSAFIFYISVQELAHTGFKFVSIFTLCLGMWMVVYFLVFIFGQKIEINEQRLISRYSCDGGKSKLLPKFYNGDIDLAEISSVTIARIEYFEKHVDEYKNQRLQDLISTYRGISIPMGHGIPLSAPIGFAIGSIPLIYVASKDGSGIEITTKPFSKNAIKKFIKELRRRAIVVHLDPAVGLG